MKYIGGIQTLVERSRIFKDKDVCVNIIANPVAGGFTIKRKARQNRIFLNAAIDAVRDRKIVTKSCTVTLHRTTAPVHAKTLANGILELAEKAHSPSVIYLIITAGGDGTSLEVQSEFARVVLEEKKTELIGRICLLRLPFGTGNDGSDGRTLDESLALLTDDSIFFRQGAISVHTAENARTPWYSFNIASIGVDAFITHMTNKLKGSLPGDFYKFWIDIACLFYSRIYNVGNMHVTAVSNDGQILLEHSDPMIFYVMGVSGKRTYGSNQKILSTEHNVCAAHEMSLLKKLKIKNHFKNGTHISFPEIMSYTANKLIFDYHEKILIQLDGETHLVKPSQFPLAFELTEPFITILKPANAIP